MRVPVAQVEPTATAAVHAQEPSVPRQSSMRTSSSGNSSGLGSVASMGRTLSSYSSGGTTPTAVRLTTASTWVSAALSVGRSRCILAVQGCTCAGSTTSSVLLVCVCFCAAPRSQHYDTSGPIKSGIYSVVHVLSALTCRRSRHGHGWGTDGLHTDTYTAVRPGRMHMTAGIRMQSTQASSAGFLIVSHVGRHVADVQMSCSMLEGSSMGTVAAPRMQI